MSLTTATDDSADLVIWTSLEADVVIMAACIPAMQPLVDYLFPHPSDSSSSSATPSSPTSFTPRKKLWSISHDPEAARDCDTELKMPEMIMVERDFQINVTKSVHREWSPDTNPSAVTEEEKFRIVKDHGPDGVVTTTVVVMTSAPADITRFPQA